MRPADQPITPPPALARNANSVHVNAKVNGDGLILAMDLGRFK
jgi:hypothetical protein